MYALTRAENMNVKVHVNAAIEYLEAIKKECEKEEGPHWAPYMQEKIDRVSYRISNIQYLLASAIREQEEQK